MIKRNLPDFTHPALRGVTLRLRRPGALARQRLMLEAPKLVAVVAGNVERLGAEVPIREMEHGYAFCCNLIREAVREDDEAVAFGENDLDLGGVYLLLALLAHIANHTLAADLGVEYGDLISSIEGAAADSPAPESMSAEEE